MISYILWYHRYDIIDIDYDIIVACLYGSIVCDITGMISYYLNMISYLWFHSTYDIIDMISYTPARKCVFWLVLDGVPNQVFWLALDDAFSWRSMSNLSRDTVEDIESLAESQYLSIPGSNSGSKFSKFVSSKIRILSQVMCLLVCLSTYMSMKCVAYAGVTSTVVEEESNELKRSLRRVHTPLSIASVTKGLSGELYRASARRTCVYAYREAGITCSPYNPNRNCWSSSLGQEAGRFRSFALRNALYGRNLCLSSFSLSLTWQGILV